MIENGASIIDVLVCFSDQPVDRPTAVGVGTAGGCEHLADPGRWFPGMSLCQCWALYWCTIHHINAGPSNGVQCTLYQHGAKHWCPTHYSTLGQALVPYTLFYAGPSTGALHTVLRWAQHWCPTHLVNTWLSTGALHTLSILGPAPVPYTPCQYLAQHWCPTFH